LLPLVGARIDSLRVYDRRLRLPVASVQLRRALVGKRIVGVGRRAKYLLLDIEAAPRLVVHLGMSGNLQVMSPEAPRQKHTHLVWSLSGNRQLRFRDPRRFGMVFLVDPAQQHLHPRFRSLGPEPLDDIFNVDYIVKRAHGVHKPVKNFLMDAAVVVGVGNIYASEALFAAMIRPTTAAGRIRPQRWERLVQAVKATLTQAIESGGTTLKDFQDGQGDGGWFQNELNVYGRSGESCRRCHSRVRRLVQAGRSTFYCGGCQT
jgi:formamidopyrimidine-DNA glycosylase